MDGSLFIHCKTKLTGVFTRLWWNDAVLNSLKPLPTSTTKKQIPSNPFLPVPHRKKFPQTPSHQYHRNQFPQTHSYQYGTETNSLKPFPTSTTQKQIFHAPITLSKQPNFRQMPEEPHTCYSGLQSCKSTLFLQLHMYAHQDLTNKPKNQKAIIPGTLM